MSDAKVLIIVPSLGQRIELLRETFTSIVSQPVPCTLMLVAPAGAAEARDLATEFGARFVEDPGSLAGAINLGISLAGPDIEFVNWIGDDDLLEPSSLTLTTKALESQANAVLAYGACRYIDEAGRELWISRAGKWAPRILKWGPDLIPQPGMLVRRSAWDSVGGLDESFRFAFDLDLLLKLQTRGNFIDVGEVVSSFRWHGDSLTVGDRTTSLRESERARRLALGPAARRLAFLWEGPVRVATRMAASELHRRAEKRAKAVAS